MTLNRIIALILRYFTEFDSLGAHYVTVVGYRLIKFDAEYPFTCTPWPKLATQ